MMKLDAPICREDQGTFFIILKMEVKTSFETSLTRYQPADGNNAEDLCSDLPSSRYTGGCINLLKPTGYVT
jgi:hypothetical protein